MSHEKKFFDYLGATASSFGTGTTGWNTSTGTASAGDANVNLWFTSGTDDGGSGPGLTQGTGQLERIGSQIKPYEMFIRGRIAWSGSNPVPQNLFLRILIVQDRECDGAAPALTDILRAPTAAAGGAQSLAFFELGYGGRFTTLMDKMLHVDPRQYWNGTNAVMSGVEGECFFEHEVDREKLETIKWDDTGFSAITNARNGHIFGYCMFVGSTISAGVIGTTYVNAPQVQLMSRIRFRDTNSA